MLFGGVVLLVDSLIHQILEDMVGMAESRREQAHEKHQAEKKVLVREIKTLRGRVTALTDLLQRKRRSRTSSNASSTGAP